MASGTCFKYCNRVQIQSQKKQRKGKHPNNWVLRGQNTNILKTHNAPGGKLREKLESVANNTANADGGRTKVIELAGKPILAGLKKQVNFGGNAGCQMGIGTKQCHIHGEGDCRIARSV